MNPSSRSVFTIGLAAAALVAPATAAFAQGSGQSGAVSVNVTGRPDLFRGSPGTNLGVPSAFGASMGDFFIGGEYVERVRTTKATNGAWNLDNGIDVGSASLGFGLGDANDVLGLTTVITAQSVARPGIGSHATFSFAASHNIDATLAVAVGVQNALSSDAAGNKGMESWYGVATKVLNAPIKSMTWLQSLTLTAGAGDGRFRLIDDQDSGSKTVAAFGSAEARFEQYCAVSVEWSGQDLNLWAPITPLKGVPITITPGIVDLTNTANKGPRFAINGGMGIHF
ncbi:MAG TPA: hypothetical protein VG916_10205 [Gemmatimonadaceae bacterium]|nr:hypothetical protein [Gemmatimonadaceae bacterium]